MPKLSGFLKFVYMCAGGGLCSFALISSAFADSCDKLDSNKTWNATFEKLNEAYQNKDYATALQYSRELENICELSPILNYTIAYIHKGLGDREKYLFYLQKSTQNTERFSVDKNALDQIWSDKYIAAHPEADPENIKARNDEIDQLKAQLAESKSEIESLKQNTISKDSHLSIQIENYKTPMWIGTGLGASGLAFVAAGAALLITSDPVTFSNKPEVPPKYSENVPHLLGWTFVGAGSVLTVAGAVLAGIYGYKYKRAKDELTLSFAPGNALVSFTF